jgi:hypothetical protein
MTGPLDHAIPLSQALPEEDRPALSEGVSLAITGVILEEHTPLNKKAWTTARINGLSLPDGKEFLKFKTSSGPVVNTLKNLISAGAFRQNGEAKVPIKVRVEGRDYTEGRGLALVDA